MPAHRPTRLGSNILLALGTVTLAQVLAPAAAQAQCNSSSNPTPPSPVVANFSNQTFGNNPPGAIQRCITWPRGCNGANGSSGESGSPGSPGQPGAQISSTNSGLTIIGGLPMDRTDSFGAPILSRGGDGGAGGESGYVVITIHWRRWRRRWRWRRFDGQFRRHFRARIRSPVWRRSGSSRLPSGARAATGGINDPNGIFEKIAGNGGAGGVRWLGDARRQWCHRRAYQAVRRRGRTGGPAALAPIHPQRHCSTRPRAAPAVTVGLGGTASLQWLSGTVQTTGFGLRATAVGGVGGNGGIAEMVLLSDPHGGNGGAGGNGGTAGVLLSGGAITVNQIPTSERGHGDPCRCKWRRWRCWRSGRHWS